MLKELCNKIEMPYDIIAKIETSEKELDFESLSKLMSLLFDKNTWDDGLNQLREILGKDTLGIKMLTVMLKCAERTFDMYKERGMDVNIFIETIKCFTRFVNEHYKGYGYYGFDRAFWTPRQLSMKLFRIGELEYETLEKDGIKKVSIHIPSDADLTLTKLRKSYNDAKVFLKKYYEDYSKVDMICVSWILAPCLKELLDSKSKILGFQNSFIIESCEPESTDYLEFVYNLYGEKRSNINLAELNEKTTLQKNMKKYVLSGKKVGLGSGILVKEPFLE